jgi:adenylate cyclase
VFELLARRGGLAPTVAELRDQFEAALALYRSQKWDEAQRGFERCLALQPGDGPSKVFVERIQHLRAQPPGAGWDGAWTLDSK